MIKFTIINNDTNETIIEYESKQLGWKEEWGDIIHSEKLADQYEKYWVKIIE